MAVFFAEVGDVGTGGFEDPQPEQPEYRHQRESARVRRLTPRSEQRFELKVRETQSRRLRRHRRPADVISG